MPCNSDYMNQTPAERHNQRAAQLYAWIVSKEVVTTFKSDAKKFAAQDTYYSSNVGQVKAVCDIIKELRELGLFEDFIRDNALEKEARELADWAEEHDAQDVRRAEAQADQKRRDSSDVIMKALDQLPQESLDKLKEIFAGLK